MDNNTNPTTAYTCEFCLDDHEVDGWTACPTRHAMLLEDGILDDAARSARRNATWDIASGTDLAMVVREDHRWTFQSLACLSLALPAY